MRRAWIIGTRFHEGIPTVGGLAGIVACTKKIVTVNIALINGEKSPSGESRRRDAKSLHRINIPNIKIPNYREGTLMESQYSDRRIFSEPPDLIDAAKELGWRRWAFKATANI